MTYVTSLVKVSSNLLVNRNVMVTELHIEIILFL